MGVALTTYESWDDPPSDNPLFRLKLRPLFVEISSDAFSTRKVLIFGETFPVEQKTQKVFIFPIKMNFLPPQKKKKQKLEKTGDTNLKKVSFWKFSSTPKKHVRKKFKKRHDDSIILGYLYGWFLKWWHPKMDGL